MGREGKLMGCGGKETGVDTEWRWMERATERTEEKDMEGKEKWQEGREGDERRKREEYGKERLEIWRQRKREGILKEGRQKSRQIR